MSEFKCYLKKYRQLAELTQEELANKNLTLTDMMGNS